MNRLIPKKLSKKIAKYYRIVELWRARHSTIIQIIEYSLLFTILLYFTYNKLDPDFGWHLQAGNYIFHHWIPSNDVFTYTASQFKWINHEWLNDVIIYWLFSAGSYLLVSIFFAALWLLSLFVAGNKSRYAIVLIGSLAMMPYVGIRPVVWTILGLAIILRLLGSQSKKNYLLICLLMLIWVNLHGGFVIGLLAILIHAINKRSYALFWLFMICLPITLLNPYGINIYQEILRTVLDGSLHSQIGEWHYFALQASGWAFIVLYWTGFWIFSRSKINSWLSMGPILFAASLSASRNFPLFVIATIGSLDSFYTSFKKVLPDKINRSSKFIIILFYVGLLVWCGYTAIYTRWDTRRDRSYPVTAVKYLNEHSCKGNLFNHYNSGGFLIWKLPNQKVYIDGRMPSWEDESGQKYLVRHNSIVDNFTWETEFKKYSIKCALIYNDSKLKEALTYNGWKIVTTEPKNSFILLISPK